MAAAPQTGSRLLALPTEIKLLICELAKEEDEFVRGRIGRPNSDLSNWAWGGRSLSCLFLASKELSSLAGTLLFDTITSYKVDDHYFLTHIFHKYRQYFTRLVLDSDSMSDSCSAIAMARSLSSIDENDKVRYQIQQLHVEDVALKTLFPGILLPGAVSDADEMTRVHSFVSFCEEIKDVTFVDLSPENLAVKTLDLFLPARSKVESLTLHSTWEQFTFDLSENQTFSAWLASLATLRRFSLTSSVNDDSASLHPTPSPLHLTTLLIDNLAMTERGAVNWSFMTSLKFLTTLKLGTANELTPVIDDFNPPFIDPERHDFPHLRSLTITSLPGHFVFLVPAFYRAPLEEFHYIMSGHIVSPFSVEADLFDHLNPKLHRFSITSSNSNFDHNLSSFVNVAKRAWPSILPRACLSNGWKTDNWVCKGEAELEFILGVTSYAKHVKESNVDPVDAKRVWKWTEELLEPLKAAAREEA